ncbi:MAG: orotate phosphoribosyltransferase [Firmicutes bacterium]|nr:orotate phosphoribosyltransferase [Bacillota bacterium]
MSTVEKIFIETGAIQKGHFTLSSGLHSDTYLQCALVLQYPDKAEQLSSLMAEKLKDQKVDTVIGPAMGGITWAYQLGHALGCRAIFSERVEDVMTLRRGFAVTPGERVLVAEDVSTTGGSAMEVVRMLQGMRAEVMGVALIVDRTNGKLDFGVPYHALYNLQPQVWEPQTCPLCQQGVPVNKPGSRK